VFDRIWEKESGGSAIDTKLPSATLTAYFEGVVPEYDRNRVYISDIKKVLAWYNIMQKLNLLVKEEEVVAGTDKAETATEATATKPAAAKSAAAKSGHAKAAPVKKAPPKSTTTKGRTKK
jgi:hypothetical protein